MKDQSQAGALSQISDDALFDEVMERLRAQYRKKTGKDPYDVSFEFVPRYNRYEIFMFKRQDFYRSQPKLTVIEGD